MHIGISAKWTLSAVLIVVLIVVIFSWNSISDTQASVDSETERINRIQYEALDELGAQTTQTLSLPASSLMYDNDLEGLRGLIAPLITDAPSGEEAHSSYSAVYATIIAPDGRVWVTVVDPGIKRLKMADTVYFERGRESGESIESISTSYLSKFKSKNEPEEVKREVVTMRDDVVEKAIRQYVVPVRGKSNEETGEAANIQGYIVIGYSIEGLQSEIRAIRSEGEERKSEVITNAIKIALLAILIGLAIAGVQSLMITRNIKKLSKAANQIAGGDLGVRSEVRSRDEIGQLSTQFNVMADRVQTLMLETEQKAMLEKEVDIARSIQSTLLPPSGFAQCGCVSLNGYFQPASECGGDFWSYNLLPDRSVLLTIGDVTGHGVPSAMITACAKSALDTILHMQTTQSINLSKLLEEMNVAICQTAKRTLFMTFQAILISPDGRSAEVGNAGHNFPLLMRANAVWGLVVRGERLGDNPNATYQTIRTELAPGDLFLLYTDGITEYLNTQGAEYGEKRLRKVIGTLSSIDVNHAMQFLWSDFTSFCQNAPQNDDITLTFAAIS